MPSSSCSSPSPSESSPVATTSRKRGRSESVGDSLSKLGKHGDEPSSSIVTIQSATDSRKEEETTRTITSPPPPMNNNTNDSNADKNAHKSTNPNHEGQEIRNDNSSSSGSGSNGNNGNYQGIVGKSTTTTTITTNDATVNFTTVYVGNIPRDCCTKAVLETLMKPYGRLIHVQVIVPTHSSSTTSAPFERRDVAGRGGGYGGRPFQGYMGGGGTRHSHSSASTSRPAYAFCQFETVAQARTARRLLHGRRLRGRILQVRPANAQKTDGQGGVGGYGNGYGAGDVRVGASSGLASAVNNTSILPSTGGGTQVGGHNNIPSSSHQPQLQKQRRQIESKIDAIRRKLQEKRMTQV